MGFEERRDAAMARLEKGGDVVVVPWRLAHTLSSSRHASCYDVHECGSA